MVRFLNMAGWLLAWALVAPLASITATWRRALLALVITVLGAALVMRSCGSRGLRVATFNIENYGGVRATPTDEGRLVELLRELDADVIAVQEIQDPAQFATLVDQIGAPGRRYQFVPSKCGGKRTMHVGFVVDERRVKLLGTQEFPELAPGRDDACDMQDRPGLLAEFALGAQRFALLVVHFTAKSDTGAMQRRRVQWQKALSIARVQRAEANVPVAIIGDVNSTGFLDDDRGERTFIENQLADAGMTLPTAGLGCSEYFRRNGAGPYRRSLLDHVAISDDFLARPVATVHGYCSELGCPAKIDPLPRDFVGVSDHCPVSVGAR